MQKSQVGLQARKILNDPNRQSEFSGAIATLKKAAKRNDSDALLLLGLYYSEGRVVQKNIKKSVRYYKKAIRLGDARAMQNLANKYMNGDGVTKNEKLALSLYKMSAEKGMVNSQYNMGVFKYFGQGCSVNYDEAHHWLTLAVENGDNQAKTKLAYCYLKGHGTLQNTSKYMELIQAAATGGDAEAMAHLGKEYLDGSKTTRDYKLALKYLTDAASKQHRLGLFYLGNMYNDGLGLANPDKSKALEHWLSAANQGLSAAQFNVGLAYYEGKGCKKDYSKSVKWYEKAAQRNNQDAILNLGMCYSHGRGVVQNDDKAREWWRRGEGFGDERCKLALANLEEVLRSERQIKTSYSSLQESRSSHAGECRYCGNSFSAFKGYEGNFCSVRCSRGFYGEGSNLTSSLDLNLPSRAYHSGDCRWCSSHFDMGEGFEGDYCSIKCYTEWYNS